MGSVHCLTAGDYHCFVLHQSPSQRHRVDIFQPGPHEAAACGKAELVARKYCGPASYPVQGRGQQLGTNRVSEGEESRHRGVSRVRIDLAQQLA